jgi:hypothetical protein
MLATSRKIILKWILDKLVVRMTGLNNLRIWPVMHSYDDDDEHSGSIT